MRAVYITVYEVSLARGGGEEGGWWYDFGTVYRVIPTTAAKGARLLERVRAWCDRANEGSPPRSSVIGTPDFEATLGAEPGEPYPESRPIYE